MQWSTCPPERWVTLLRTCSDLAGGNNDISWIDDWQKLLVIIKSRPSYNSDRHYVLIKPATWFIRVKLYSKQCQLSIRLVYLTVITYNIQYLQYFCDDIENSCTMNLKLLGLQSISFFFRGNIYWVWHRTLFFALIWSVYFVSGDHICMRAPRENVNNSLIFWAYPPISPYFFGAPCFRSFSIFRIRRQCHWDIFMSIPRTL